MPPARATRAIVKELRELGALAEDDDGTVNSVIKLRLYPTLVQKEKLDQMFTTNRAVYNKLVARSVEDRKTRLAAKVDKMSWAEFDDKYQPIARLRHISKYFRNKKALQRHKAVHDEVRDSAFRDFIKAMKASIAGLFASKSRNEKMTFPEMRFKSKFAPSNTIEIAKHSISRVQRDGNECVRFHPKFVGFNKSDGIFINEDLPEVTMSVRLQRLREGTYFLIVPRLRQFTKLSSEHICTIDPGVRNFATVYDPDGRTFSVTGSKSIMMNKFKVIDQMKSLLNRMDNASKAKHQDWKRTKNKQGRTNSKTEEGRLRYRLRRRIWFTSRKATRAMTDLQQKLSSWLSANYYTVLLPSFQTAEMVHRHFEEVASDATPETASDEMRAAVLKRKIRSLTARAMMAQAHYRFKMLLEYKMVRSGGGVINCEEEYTSKTCSRCGAINHKLGGKHMFQCPSCNVVLD